MLNTNGFKYANPRWTFPTCRLAGVRRRAAAGCHAFAASPTLEALAPNFIGAAKAC